MKKFILFICISTLIFNLTSCSSNPTSMTSEFLDLFDTVTQVMSFQSNENEFKNHVQFIHDELETYHQFFDIYNDYDGINNIKTINDNAGIQPIKVDAKIIDLLKFCKTQYDNTNKLVNPAIGAVTKIWHDYREKATYSPIDAQLPSMEELTTASQFTNFDEVVIDEENSTVFLPNENMRLDVGAIAKGYSVEQVTQVAIANGFTNGIISVGGNVRAIGLKPDGSKWNVGVQNYDTDNEEKPLLYLVTLSDLSLVTSGDYQRYFTVDSKDYHHIIDPNTLFPSEYYHAVSVFTENSGYADALSTALFNMPLEESQAYVESLEGVYVIWITVDGEVYFSDGVEDFISKEY